VKAVVLSEPGVFAVERLDDPAPAPDEVVVAPTGCGVCGTDLHLIDGELPDALYPIVPGHEFAGTVVAVGREVAGVREGDSVAIEPKVVCGHCHFCRLGRSNLCDRGRSVGVIGIDGGCAEFVAVPAEKTFVLPDGFPHRWGALMEPVACAVHGFDKVGLRLADHVLIYGAGTMGLLLCQLAVAHGAGSVCVVDLNTARLERAAAMGADGTATGPDQLDRPQGWEVVIDATGSVPAIEDGLRRVRKGGTFLMFGVTPDTATARFSPFSVFHEEIRIVGSRAILHSFARAGELLGRGVIDGDAMLTHRLPLEDYGLAIDLFRRGEGVKIEIAPAA
jgi:2-desacetyl-2-hydroxyethyl bacteriochlorophyllide A dehydrogenase